MYHFSYMLCRGFTLISTFFKDIISNESISLDSEYKLSLVSDLVRVSKLSVLFIQVSLLQFGPSNQLVQIPQKRYKCSRQSDQ